MADPISVREAYHLSLLTEIAYFNTQISGGSTGLDETTTFRGSTQVFDALFSASYRTQLAQDALGAGSATQAIEAWVEDAVISAADELDNHFDGIVAVQNSMSGDNEITVTVH